MNNAIGRFSREQLELMIESDHAQCGDVASMARALLAVMDAKPFAYFVESKDEECGHIEWSECSKGIPGSIPGYTTPPASIAAPDGWIYCNEQMPKSDEQKPIAIYTGKCIGQGMFVATYDEDGFFDYWEGNEITGVTHWMPLPAAPGGS